MRVLVDGYWWSSGPPSGRIVLRDIVMNWAAAYPTDKIYVALPASSDGPEDELPENIEFIRTRLKFHPAINALELPIIARRLSGIQGIFTQNFATAFSKSTVFIHDSIFLRSPEWFTRKELLYLRLISILLNRRSRVVTSSRTEAAKLKVALGLNYLPDAVGLGISTSLANSNTRRPSAAVGVDNFIVAVGRLNVRKNVVGAIQASLASGVVSEDTPLFVVGAANGRESVGLDSLEIAMQNGVVRFTGFVEDAELRWLYENCSLMVYLSLDEGFGLPPLEAATFGSPVLVSDLAIFREVLGAYAFYADPKNVKEASETIASIVNSAGRGLPRNVLSFSMPEAYKWENVVRLIRSRMVG